MVGEITNNDALDVTLTDVTAKEPTEDALADVAEDVETSDITSDAEGSEEPVDYGALARADMEQLRRQFPELASKKSITELKNPLRYAALRDLGLSPREAYLATEDRPQRYDNRSHLRSSVPGGAQESQDRLGGGELEAARELFSGLSDRELQRLYKKVTR